MSQFDMYRTKKKRAVDPNAPPRPNLLSHEKTLKDNRATMEQQAQHIQQLEQRISQLESKLVSQTAYLSYLHQHISRNSKS